MARYLFIAQQTLTSWLEQDKISFVDTIMTIKSDGRMFRLREALRFIKLEEGEDAPCLLGKVKTLDQLAAMKAERCCDSVIFQDSAYKVQEGFIGEVMVSDSAAPILLEVSKLAKTDSHTPPPVATADTEEKKKENKASESDEEMLTRFLLKNL